MVRDDVCTLEAIGCMHGFNQGLCPCDTYCVIVLSTSWQNLMKPALLFTEVHSHLTVLSYHISWSMPRVISAINITKHLHQDLFLFLTRQRGASLFLHKLDISLPLKRVMINCKMQRTPVSGKGPMKTHQKDNSLHRPLSTNGVQETTEKVQ